MRENRTCGSEGGEAQSLPYPYPSGYPFPFPCHFPLGLPPTFPSPWRPADCKSVITGDPGSGAFWGDAHTGVSRRVQLGAYRIKAQRQS